ncbi:hypothetical protein ACFVXG_07675 [Kitasatospora sp. NPDC058162]|uniref:hypothetical protein n=1 Tax=Kitasatospora sp. NPDC058162 TaxID=3346362 RepID=UPI0036DD43AC
MGFLRKAADRVALAMPDDRKLSTAIGLASSIAHDADLTTAAAVTSGLGVAAIVAQTLYGPVDPPEDGYAGFTTDGDKPKRGWRR